MVDPIPMIQLFDKGVQVRMGQAHVKSWVDEIMPLSPTTPTRSGPKTSPRTRSGSSDVPEAYEKFQKKEDGAIKFVIQP